MKQPQGSMYGMLWRWHFFAALVVVPFVLWQAVTGVTYLWHRELAAAANPALLYVEPAAQQVTYQAQLDEALQHQAAENLTQIQIEAASNRSTVFMFTAANGLPYPAFVNPYTGAYLGTIAPAAWIPGASRALHGGWPLGNFGSYLLELGACWAIVMILTGLYLWWPRHATRLAGALYPRLGQGTRIFWRDVHSVVGVYFSLIVLAFLVTALPWTSFWGANVLAPIQTALGQSSPADRFFAHGPTHDAAGEHAQTAVNEHAHHQQLSLDAIVAIARQQGLQGGLDINWQADTAALRSHATRSQNRVYLRLDKATGEIAERAGWEAFPLVPRIVSLGVDLHEGRYFGRANQIFNTLVASALVWLAYSGFMGWYRRRPQRGLAPPPKQHKIFPAPLLITIVCLGLALPLLGASILLLLVCDRLFNKFLTPTPA